MKIGELYYDIEIDMTKFRQSMAEAQQKVSNATVDLKTKLQPALEKIEKAAKNAAIAMAAGFGAIVTSGLKANANMEQYKNTLNTVMGDSVKAAETLDWVKKYAAATPFEIPELVESTVKLQAMGLEAQKMLPIAADMAAVFKSSGKDVGDAAEAINDAMMGEFERLKEFGIKLSATDFAAGGKYAGKTYAEAITEEVKNHNYTGAADALGSTFIGRLSTLGDTLGQTIQTITAPIFEKLSISLGGIIAKIDELSANGQLQAWTEQATAAMTKIWDVLTKVGGVIADIAMAIIDNWNIIGPILAGAVAAIVAFEVINTVTALMNAWKAITLSLTIAQGGLNAVLAANPIGLVVLAIGALVAAGVALYQNWDTIKAKAQELWDKINDTWEGIKKKTSEAWNTVQTTIITVVTNIRTEFNNMITAATSWGSNLIQNFINGIKAKWDELKSIVSEAASMVSDFLGFSSPTKEGPGRYADRWAPNLVNMFAEGIKSSMPALQVSLVDMAALTPAVLGQSISNTSTSNNSTSNYSFNINVSGGSTREQAEGIMRELHRLGVRF